MSVDEPRAPLASPPDNKPESAALAARLKLGNSLFPLALSPPCGLPYHPTSRLTDRRTPAVRPVWLVVIRTRGVGGGISARRFASGIASAFGVATLRFDCVMRDPAVARGRIRTERSQRESSPCPNWC